jgi:hypothetical protein
MTAEKVRIDMADLTLGELAEVGELLGMSLQDAMTGPAQPRAVAALACVVARRTDPAYTFDQALALHMTDLEIVNAPDAAGEPSAGSNGAAPAVLPASGG